MRFAILPLAFVLALPALAAGPTGLLNDTGQTSCYDASNAAVACDSAGVGSDGGVNPRQDARFGRDAKAAAGTLTKIGGGAAGFDFTKICWNGDAEGSGTCTGTLVANTGGTASGTPSTDWACTKDNVTNLIWSLQSGWGNWTYATTTYPTAMNGTSRCGFNSGWRAPTRRELLSIVHHGASNPAIDASYFPATVNDYYWSSDIYVPAPAVVWDVDFSIGFTFAYNKAFTYYVRLVRSGQ
ncbi:MAG: DUF1566 domain-containing protein [Sulfuricella sp.]|nr:DUF1566 domain-containing protein [Sulfuricella sp.]